MIEATTATGTATGPATGTATGTATKAEMVAEIEIEIEIESPVAGVRGRPAMTAGSRRQTEAGRTTAETGASAGMSATGAASAGGTIESMGEMIAASASPPALASVIAGTAMSATAVATMTGTLCVSATARARANANASESVAARMRAAIVVGATVVATHSAMPIPRSASTGWSPHAPPEMAPRATARRREGTRMPAGADPGVAVKAPAQGLARAEALDTEGAGATDLQATFALVCKR